MILKFVHNPEGYIRYYGPEEHYHFYHIKDKANSNANASGIYNNYPLIRNNQTKSLIKSFYPIYP